MIRPASPNSRESLHVRGVLVAERASVAPEKFQGRRMHDAEELPHPARGWAGYVRIPAKVEGGQIQLIRGKGSEQQLKNFIIPASLLARVLSGGRCVFEPVISGLELDGGGATLILFPFVPIFPELFKQPPSEYYRIDLRCLCDDQFRGSADANIKITRLYCKLDNDLGERVSSITCSGKSVVSSDVLRDLLRCSKDAPPDLSPFSLEAIRNGMVERALDPVSCRIQWDDGSGSSISINMDRYGNFSLYLRGTQTLVDMFPILRYLSTIGALKPSSSSPIDRSDAALHEVDSK